MSNRIWDLIKFSNFLLSNFREPYIKKNAYKSKFKVEGTE